ncbi:cadherin-like beta sandwich domain-containing protein [Flavobacterium pectinovorum]|uniref:Gliding motility-associated C-terminal domain-containing protein n=1 Tax=Flavobacterium pectinovorum TaxID=29533 RepID=A0A502ED47_9FLAO|nr:cadherin-like beta sandwich domain-containing protein [Flavobacterium pectinovorum]TPG35357.1 hypothetical protein EAH81_21595 [Flavobacterium pectinovorum]
MNRIKIKMNKNLLIVLAFLLFDLGYGQNIITWKGGNAGSAQDWDTPANWNPSRRPVAGDDVIIPNTAFQPIIVGDAYCKSIKLSNSIPGGVVLSVNGDGILIVDNSLEMDSGTSLRIGTGNLFITGDVKMNGGPLQNDVTFTGAGNLTIGGTMTGGTLNAGTGKVEYNSTAPQTVGVYVYNNLTLSGSGLKTITTSNTGVNNTLSMEGTATTSAPPTYGNNATLKYNSSVSHTAGPEWIPYFTSTGGIVIANTGAVTIAVEKKIGKDTPLSIAGRASLLISGQSNFYFGGNLINKGKLISDGVIYIDGDAESQSIDGFTSKGIIMAKNSGKATFTQDMTSGTLTFNGVAGTLNLGTGLTHSFTNWIRFQGILNADSSLLKFSGDVIDNGGSFIAGTGTVEFNGGAQNLGAGSITYNNLTLSGNGTKTFAAQTTINETISIASNIVVDLGATLVHTAKTIKLGGALGAGGSWGSKLSNAVNTDDTFFVRNNGIINVGPTMAVDKSTIAALTTEYGTPSAPSSFVLTAMAMVENILVTPSSEFEVSFDVDKNFSNTVTIPAGATITRTVYVRLKATTRAGDYLSGTVILSSGTTTTSIVIPVAKSTVNKAKLTIIADNLVKNYGEENPTLTFTYNKFVNEETNVVLTAQPVITTTVDKNTNFGSYPQSITVSGAKAENYDITYTAGNFTVNPLKEAGLGNLTISNGPLSPLFVEGTFAYNAISVPYKQTSVTVTPTAKDVTATIKVNNIAVVSGTPFEVVNLQVGSNTIITRVLAQDNLTYKDYVITIAREPASSNAGLTDLAISDGTLSPAFAEGTTKYIATVPNDVTNIKVTPVSADTTATITVNGKEVPSGTASGGLPLQVGENTITTVVTAQDGTINTYTVIVTRASSSNSGLTDLAISEGTLSPAFAEGTIAYTATVPYDIANITVTPITADTTATVTINGKEVPSGTASTDLPLKVGENTIKTVVTAQDGTTTTYTVVVTREEAPLSNNSGLTDLAISEGTLSPAFAEGIIAYTATVPYDIANITVTPITTDTTATVTVNGKEVPSGTASTDLPLKVGENTITTVVTAQDGTTTTYTVVVTREEAPLSSDAGLSDIVVSDGTLSPAFNTDTKGYSVDVPYETDSIIITPKAIDPDAKVEMIVDGITITDNKSPIDLKVGENEITVVVTAPDGTQETYIVVVNRADAIPQAIIPTNIITPNGDGKNDFWIVPGLDKYPNNSVKVFDRAARLVYSKNNYTNEWDGTYKGSPLNEDTYYYLIDLGNGSPKMKGFISIIRDNN